MSKKFVFMFVVAFAACLLLTSVGFAKTVGIVMPTKSLERWNRDGEFLKRQFESKGYDVSIRYSDNKIDQQVKDIEGLIANNVDLLVIAPINGLVLTQVLQDAEGEIPVIVYDRLIMNSKAVQRQSEMTTPETTKSLLRDRTETLRTLQILLTESRQ